MEKNFIFHYDEKNRKILIRLVSHDDIKNIYDAAFDGFFVGTEQIRKMKAKKAEKIMGKTIICLINCVSTNKISIRDYDSIVEREIYRLNSQDEKQGPVATHHHPQE